MESIYLDYGATAPLDAAALSAMQQAWRLGPLNPASQHAAGRHARRLVDDARDVIARALGAPPAGPGGARVVFTSGGTEANNLALLGLAGKPPARIVVSAVEHPSVRETAHELARRGFEVRFARVDARGVLDLEQFAEMARGARLASVMLGNNETGVLQPVAEAAAVCRATGALLHTDATQAVGKIAVDFAALGVDALTCSAHKLHGPVGVGALLARAGAALTPQLHGGFQQQGARSGTEPVALAVGFAKALDGWREDAAPRLARLTELRNLFETRLRGAERVEIQGGDAPRLPHISGVSFLGLDRQALLMALDLAGVRCSTGSACASGSSEPSLVLQAMGCSPESVEGALRFSFGRELAHADVLAACNRILNVVSDLRSKKAARKTPGTARSPASRPV